MDEGDKKGKRERWQGWLSRKVCLVLLVHTLLSGTLIDERSLHIACTHTVDCISIIKL